MNKDRPGPLLNHSDNSGRKEAGVIPPKTEEIKEQEAGQQQVKGV